MAIQGIIFDNQLVRSKDFGALFSGILEDGILKGCAIDFTGNQLTVGAGYLIIAGRLVRLTSAHTTETTASGTVARVVVEIDLNATATETDFSQVSFLVQYAANESSLPALVKDDINGGTGTKYQAELCVLALNQGNIDRIISQKTVAPVVSATANQALETAQAALPKAGGTITGTLTQAGMLKLGTANYGTALPAAGNAGRVFFKKV